MAGRDLFANTKPTTTDKPVGRDLLAKDTDVVEVEKTTSQETKPGRDLLAEKKQEGRDLFVEKEESFIDKAGNLVKNIAKDITRPIIESIARPVQGAELLASTVGIEPYASAYKRGTVVPPTISGPLERAYGTIPATRTAKEATGVAAQTVAPFVSSGAGSGMLFFGGQALEADKSPAQVTAQAVIGGVVGKAGEILVRGAGGYLKRAAKGNFKVQLPTKEVVQKTISDVVNLPKTIMASADLSAPFRQGVFFIGRPKQFIPAMTESVKYAFSKKTFEKSMNQIRTRATYPVMQKGELSLTEIGENIAKREEAFMSSFADDIPIVGKIVQGSDRFFTGFLNKIRADVFDDLLRGAEKSGVEITDNLVKSAGSFINSATGRGSLGSLENQSVNLSNALFSPRLIQARIDMLNPVFYAKLDPFVRKEAIKSLLTFAGTGMTVLGLAKKGGADVEGDPRSSDFGKIKVGNTRYSIFGGFEPYIRSAAQLITGQSKNTTTGVIKEKSREKTVGQFIKGKESPAASFVHSLLSGKDFLGKDLDISKELQDRFTPLVIQDLNDIMEEEGIVKGAVMAAPAIFGVGVQSYKQGVKQRVSGAKGVLKERTNLLKQGRVDEAKDLYNRNKEYIRTGSMLDGYQKNINQYTKLIKDTSKNTRLSKSEKKKRIDKYETRLEAVQGKADNKLKDLEKREKNKSKLK